MRLFDASEDPETIAAPLRPKSIVDGLSFLDSPRTATCVWETNTASTVCFVISLLCSVAPS